MRTKTPTTRFSILHTAIRDHLPKWLRLLRISLIACKLSMCRKTNSHQTVELYPLKRPRNLLDTNQIGHWKEGLSGTSTGTKNCWKKLVEKKRSGLFMGNVRMENSNTLSATKLVPDKWLSRMLDYHVYRLDIARPEAYCGGLEFDWPADDRWFIYTKAPTNGLELINALEDAGFRLIESNLQLEKSMNPLPEPIDPNHVRFAVPEDEAAVRSVSEHSFVYSRFHLDPAISNNLADRVKVAWAANYFAGQRGNAMVLAEHKGKVAGFLQLIFQGDVLVIDLIAVEPARRKMGLAHDMIAFARCNFPGFRLLRVGTQVSNVPSIRLYEKLGFRIVKSQYVLHRHFFRWVLDLNME